MDGRDFSFYQYSFSCFRCTFVTNSHIYYTNNTEHIQHVTTCNCALHLISPDSEDFQNEHPFNYKNPQIGHALEGAWKVFSHPFAEPKKQRLEPCTKETPRAFLGKWRSKALHFKEGFYEWNLGAAKAANKNSTRKAFTH